MNYAAIPKRNVIITLLISLFLIEPGAAQPKAADPQSSDPATQPTPAPAAGIRTDFGDVVIDNLGIGQTYNLRELAGVPLKVTNTGIGTIDLLIDPHIPSGDMILGTRRELGYRPIPDASWVSVSKSQFILPPNESAYTDVIIKIPNDPSLYGKKFQASIYSRSTDLGGLNLGVWSHLLIKIVQSPEEQALIEKNRKHGFMGSMDYTLIPDKLVITNPPLGRRYDITKENKKTIKIANSGSSPIKLRVRVMRVGDTPLSLQTGYSEPENPGWLKIKNPDLTVEPNSFADPGFSVEFPNDPAIKKKKFMFIIKVEPTDSDIVGVTFYGKIYAEWEE